jgi:hypothetical protein
MATDFGSYRSVVQFTRPANTTQYTANDVVGTTTSAIHQLSNLGKLGGFVQIQSVRLQIHVASVPSGMSGFRAHFYTASPTAIADNAAFDLVVADRASYVGFVDMPTPQDFGSTLFCQADYPGSLIQFANNSNGLWCQLQTLGTFTPGANSEVYELRVLTLDSGYRSW